MNDHTIRRALGAAAVITAVIAAAPVQAQQQRGAERPRAERMQQRQQVTPEQRLERRLAMLTERLELSADQAARVRTVLQREGEQLRALHEKAGVAPGRMMGERGPRGDGAQARPRGERRDTAQRAERCEQMQQLRTEVQQIRERTDTELAKVLDAEQLKKYQSLRQGMQRGGMQGGKAHQPHARGAAR